MNKGSLCPWKGKSNPWEVRGAVGQTLKAWAELCQNQECSQSCNTCRDGKGSLSWEQEGALADLVWRDLVWIPIKTEIHWFERASYGSQPHTNQLQPLLSGPCFHKHHKAGVRRTTEILQCSPHPLWGTEYFPSLEEQPRRAAYLNKLVQMPGTRRLRGRTPTHCLNSACTAHSSSCLTLHKHKIIVSFHNAIVCLAYRLCILSYQHGRPS